MIRDVGFTPNSRHPWLGRHVRFVQLADLIAERVRASALPGPLSAINGHNRLNRCSAESYDKLAANFLSGVVLAATIAFWT